jgi:hypothetical protein
MICRSTLLRAGRLAVLLVAPATLTGFAQSQPADPSFEVASVKRNVSSEPGGFIRVEEGVRFNATGVPLAFILRQAYGVMETQVVNQPYKTRQNENGKKPNNKMKGKKNPKKKKIRKKNKRERKKIAMEQKKNDSGIKEEEGYRKNSQIKDHGTKTSTKVSPASRYDIRREGFRWVPTGNPICPQTPLAARHKPISGFPVNTRKNGETCHTYDLR